MNSTILLHMVPCFHLANENTHCSKYMCTYICGRKWTTLSFCHLHGPEPIMKDDFICFSLAIQTNCSRSSNMTFLPFILSLKDFQ